MEFGHGDVPVFWACGVTPQAAVMASRIPFAITHAPGYMLVTDIPESAYVLEAPMCVDLNCDLGEGFGQWTMADDEALLEHRHQREHRVRISRRGPDDHATGL